MMQLTIVGKEGMFPIKMRINWNSLQRN